ncbi:MAG: hypothetical protein EXS13_04735 [Planctomycetes bacterium]|nr:hypothetical protein [Planctomycetota bacterium]
MDRPMRIWSETATTGELHAIVLAGGFGRRLEPLTRRLFGESIPKQFCRFGKGRSLLQQTIVRLAPLTSGAQVTVVVDASQVQRAEAQLVAFRGTALVVQPCDRGTAAGVLLPLLDLAARAPDAIVLLAASDHGVADEALFRATLRAAEQSVRADPGRLVLIGARPDAANSDYGWIVRGAPTHEGLDSVARFVEKPAPVLACDLLASGEALWNTMVLLGTARALLELFEDQLPELTRAMRALLRRELGAEPFAQAYASLPAANFSADVIGRAPGLVVATLPIAAGWTDLGTESRMLEWLARHPAVDAAAAKSELVTHG